MITGINESIYHANVNVILMAEIVIQINVWNNDKCRCKGKTYNVCEKDYVWNPATYNCKNGHTRS